MTVEEARAEYAAVADAIDDSAIVHLTRPKYAQGTATCPECLWLGRLIEAASLAYDLAVAEASMRRLRESVAWA